MILGTSIIITEKSYQGVFMGQGKSVSSSRNSSSSYSTSAVAGNARQQAQFLATQRSERKITLPLNSRGETARIQDYYGENVFDIRFARGIPERVRQELIEVAQTRRPLSREYAEIIAQAVTEWATSKGATHFCHWFQPLTGSTAEKHDSFLQFDDSGKPIDKLSVGQLLQGEPDASSFPHGGSRSTFEARGYTSWDVTSPMFITESANGKTLCIPTAFVSYYGDALDIKTPLLRSANALSKVVTNFLHLIGKEDTKSVVATCGAEQEFFLIDQSFYFARPDLVMTGRTLFGSLTAKNQQLEDYYFGTIPERVLSFLSEVDIELHRLGVPCKTRHNEVAPAQFEIAPIFGEANIAADHNQLTMAVLKKVAEKHQFVCLLHEKPFSGVNGSGKHVNWSMQDNTGLNLLEPGNEPHQNTRFLAILSTIVEAVRRHSGMLRASIAGHGNDHRLGANEAPPSIISVFLGDTLDRICRSVMESKEFTPGAREALDLGAEQIAQLVRDNTDRNRTSPFAFTGNKFEFRAVGSSQAIGLPMAILNAAVADVFEETNSLLKEELAKGLDVDQALLNVTKHWLKNSYHVVFNGDGYSQEWIVEAEKRGLPNYRTTPDALRVFSRSDEYSFLTRLGVFKESELKTRFNVLIERYNKHRVIEFKTLTSMIQQSILPDILSYKAMLVDLASQEEKLGTSSFVEKDLLKHLQRLIEDIYKGSMILREKASAIDCEHVDDADKVANDLMPQMERLAKSINEVEELIPQSMWSTPTYYDMLFLR